MAASRAEVDSWISTAKATKCKYILSVCDTFDWEDYPVYCLDEVELFEEYYAHNNVDMQRINEIIRINKDGSVNENIRLRDIEGITIVKVRKENGK